MSFTSSSIIVFTILFCFYIANGNGATNNCFQEGNTWRTDGQLDFVPNIISLQDCAKICLQIEDCKGSFILKPLANLSSVNHCWPKNLERFVGQIFKVENVDNMILF